MTRNHFVSIEINEIIGAQTLYCRSALYEYHSSGMNMKPYCFKAAHVFLSNGSFTNLFPKVFCWCVSFHLYFIY